MGATNFFDVAFGKDAQDAYKNAVEQAVWDHGHESYSGTIKEKGGFRLVTPTFKIDPSKLEQWCGNWLCTDNSGKFVYQKKIPKKYRAFVESVAGIYDDKWGPALCIEITGKRAKEYKVHNNLVGKHGKVFAFMGMASC